MAQAIVFGIGAWIAYRQLDAWRNEAHFRKRVEVSEQLLAAAIAVSDELKALRSPMDSIPQSEIGNFAYVYQKRYQRFIDRNDLFVRLREVQVRAEAVLDDPKIDDAVQQLFRVRNETATAIEMLAQRSKDSDEDEQTRKFYRSIQNDMYGSYSAKHDPLGMAQLEAIATLKRLLRPMLSFRK